MANFYVGQRVRVIWAGWRHHACDAEEAKRQVGSETRIAADMHDEDGDWWVLDTDWAVLKSAAGAVLTPIVPDGMQPVEWSECLWQPEGLHA